MDEWDVEAEEYHKSKPEISEEDGQYVWDECPGCGSLTQHFYECSECMALSTSSKKGA